MMTDFPSFSATAEGKRIVYVRPVRTDDLPGEIKERVAARLGRDTIYAIHASDGEVLALVPDRAQAFSVAREHEYAPVSVH
jgi:hypothetical protein